MEPSKNTKIYVTAGVWAAIQAILVAITDFTPDAWDSIILTIIVPLVTLLAKMAPQTTFIRTPQQRSGDEDDYESVFRK